MVAMKPAGLLLNRKIDLFMERGASRFRSFVSWVYELVLTRTTRRGVRSRGWLGRRCEARALLLSILLICVLRFVHLIHIMTGTPIENGNTSY